MHALSNQGGMHCIMIMCMKQWAAGIAVGKGCSLPYRRKRTARGTFWKHRYSGQRRRLLMRALQRAQSCSAARMGSPLQMELGGKARVLAKDSRAAFPSAKGFGAEDEVSKCGLQPATSPALSHMNESASVLADMQPAH